MIRVHPWLIILLLGFSPGAAQAKTTAADVLTIVEKNFKNVRDYRVDLEVTMDSPEIHVSNSKATLYFKRPDKVNMVAREGFLVLPKDAIPGDPVHWIKTNFNVTYSGDSKVGKEPVYALKLEPKTPAAHGEMKVLIEKRRGLILVTEAIRGEAKVKSRWSYVRVDKKYWLPEKVQIEMSGTLAPGVLDPSRAKFQPPVTGKGTAVVKFSGYQVNKGISDKVFEPAKR